jgi:hypothetical protein
MRFWGRIQLVLITVFMLTTLGLGGNALCEEAAGSEGPDCGDEQTAMVASTAWLHGDYGDAPEDALAYPSTGQFGYFPTCYSKTPPGYIYHAAVNTAGFGPMVDHEHEGNADSCSNLVAFPPYDADECFQDGDAGLVWPEPYTIMNLPAPTVAPCPNGSGVPLGDTCSFAVWGIAVDIDVFHLGGPDENYVNVLMDWDQNGQWGGITNCHGQPVHEHVLVNFLVPAGTSGRLSALNPPSFRIGPYAGHVWTRFTISPGPMDSTDWDGEHPSLDSGETEDYLLGISKREDYGDAPEGEMAYPPNVIGMFPTCTGGPVPGYVHHEPVGNMFFGDVVDFESDGNASNCLNTPPFPPYDADECLYDGDAGLIVPPAYTIDSMGTVLPCLPLHIGALGAPCSTAVWGRDVDIDVANTTTDDAYINVLMDWTEGGSWGGAMTCPTGTTAPEHVLINFPVPPGFVGRLSTVGPPPFIIGPNEGLVWTRFTIGNMPVPADWEGDQHFMDGETEDYLILVDAAASLKGPDGQRLMYRLYPSSPNPFDLRTTIRYELPTAQSVELSVYDATGRLVGLLVRAFKTAGKHEVVWDATDECGQPLSAGVYFCRMEADHYSKTERMVLVR